MICATCGHDNPAAARFCNDCGAALAARCPGCRADNPAGARFCNACGAALVVQVQTHADKADARKIVTILFADLAGSTALHERLDPESVRRLMERYYATVRAAIEAHRGTVVKLLGDGVMAAFGVPRVAEDDAVRAVHAAMAIVDGVRGLDLPVRVAVNTGEVVVSAGDSDLVGDPVNVAARLQQEAGHGEVVLGEATQRLVAARVTLAALGTVALKGRAESTRAYRVVSLERPAGASATPFVGREEELARLTAVYAAAVASPAAQLAVLLGSPGLGKSRLMDEVSRRLGDAATVVTAHCDAAGEATFAPLAEALREHLALDADTGAETTRAAIEAILPGDDDRKRIADGVAALLAGSPASPEETFFVVRRLLTALAVARPVVLAIDDLQWAEPLLLDLVEHLVQWGGGVPLLVLVGARPELRDVRSSLVTPGGLVADVVTLGGLDAGAATRLAANVIGAEDLPAAVAAKVLATSEGNPLFVGELVRMLVQEGALTKDGQRWSVGANLAALEMPPTIQALLAARIERLRPEERSVLECAAVVGRHFSRSAVAALSHDGRDLDARLEALRRTELIERDAGWFLGEPLLRFHHVLIRDAAYRRLLKGTRAGLHERLAGWIEGQVGDAPEHDETIGWHLEQAHKLLRDLGPVDAPGRTLGERAARRLAAAGRRALARDDVPLAGGLLGRAIARLDESDGTRADLALDWCEALLSAGDVGPAASAIAELARFAAESERFRGWYACFAGQLAVMTAPEELHAVADRVAAAARDLAMLGDAAGEAKAHFVHAQALVRLGKVGACEAALDKALAAARRAGDRRRANAVLAGAPIAALWGPSPVTRASGRCLDVVRVLRITQGAPAVEAVALSCQGVLEALRGRTDAARRMIASARKMVEELGITQRLLEADVSAGLVALLEGDAASAERDLRAAYEGLRDLGLGIDAARAAALLARALLAQDRVREAEALSHESEALAGDDLKAAIAWRGVRAEALARRGEHREAIELASAAAELAAATDALLDHADARTALAVALRAAGRYADADTEERRAIELWRAKGATLPADRRQPSSRRDSIPSDELAAAPRPHARRRVQPNGATSGGERLAAVLAARDAKALAELFEESLCVVHHPSGATYGRREMLATWRPALKAARAEFRYEVLATLGDALALARQVTVLEGLPVTGFAEFGLTEVEEISLLETDGGGRFLQVELFTPDRLGDALVRLYERHAERLPAGPARARAGAIGRSLAAYDGPVDPDRLATALAPSYRLVDHRTLGAWSARDAAEHLRHWRLQLELAPDLAQRFEDVLACEADALVVRLTASGTARDGGGAFEDRVCALLTFGPEGSVIDVDVFEAEHEAEALTLFEDLFADGDAPHRVSPPSVVARRNAATLALERWQAAFHARDWQALRALFVPDGHFEDRRRQFLLSGDAEWMISVTRDAVSGVPDLAVETSVVGIFGARVDAERVLWASGSAEAHLEVEYLTVNEVDETGRVTASISFDPDDAVGVQREAWARWTAIEPDIAPSVALLARALDAYNAHDVAAYVATMADDVVVVDHRRTGMGRIEGAAAYGAATESLWNLAPGGQVDLGWYWPASGRHGVLTMIRRHGTLADGAAYESEHLELLVQARGRFTNIEMFELDDLDAARARFEALRAHT